MLSTSEEFTHAMWAIYAAQVTVLNTMTSAAVEAGVCAVEAAAEALRGAGAHQIVLARQWQAQTNPSLLNIGH